MNEQPNLFTPPAVLARLAPDICANRHKQNPESIAANPSEANKRASHKRILAIMDIGTWTSKELADALDTKVHCISGRLSELKEMGKIRPTGERREGCSVLVRRD